MSREHTAESDGLRHKLFGLTHPTWDRPDCFMYATEQEAQAAIIRAYGECSGHVVVGPIGAAIAYIWRSPEGDKTIDPNEVTRVYATSPAKGSGYCPDVCTWPHAHRFERDGVQWPARTTVTQPEVTP